MALKKENPTQAGKILNPFTAPVKPRTPPPAELHWICPACEALVEPVFIPVPPRGRWKSRDKCRCQIELERLAQEEKERQEEVQRRIDYTYGSWLGKNKANSRVIEHLSAMRFENFQRAYAPDAYKRVFAFAQDPDFKALILSGNVGNGKSHLAAAVCNYWIHHKTPRSCVFASAPQFVHAYNDARFSNLEGRDDHYCLEGRAINAGVFVLDDPEKMKASEDRSELFFYIIDERYKSGRPTIITTNSFADLGKYITPASVSRLSRGMVLVDMQGTDYRPREKK